MTIFQRRKKPIFSSICMLNWLVRVQTATLNSLMSTDLRRKFFVILVVLVRSTRSQAFVSMAREALLLHNQIQLPSKMFLSTPLNNENTSGISLVSLKSFMSRGWRKVMRAVRMPGWPIGTQEKLKHLPAYLIWHVVRVLHVHMRLPDRLRSVQPPR